MGKQRLRDWEREIARDLPRKAANFFKTISRHFVASRVFSRPVFPRLSCDLRAFRVPSQSFTLEAHHA